MINMGTHTHMHNKKNEETILCAWEHNLKVKKKKALIFCFIGWNCDEKGERGNKFSELGLKTANRK